MAICAGRDSANVNPFQTAQVFPMKQSLAFASGAVPQGSSCNGFQQLGKLSRPATLPFLGHSLQRLVSSARPPGLHINLHDLHDLHGTRPAHNFKKFQARKPKLFLSSSR